MKVLKLSILFLTITFIQRVTAQETIPIYFDYLSDNVYLLHPAAAGIGNCAKLRVSHGQQWSGVEDAPGLQTLSYHSRFSGESNVGLGGILFRDSNGNHSQIGAQGTFAYHIDMGGENFNQLSFALSGLFVENKLDETGFILPGEDPDPIITNLVNAENYFNTDFGMAYHYKTGFAYFTIKNLLLSARNLQNTSYESLNLRRYLVGLGYFFESSRPNRVSFEPSTMIQYAERTGELNVDMNIKAYKKVGNGNTLWAGLSYRRSFDGNKIQELSQITPIIGLNFNRFMLSYTYTHGLGDIVFDNSGFHQISLGLDLFCKEARASACPNINSNFR
ncbi:MAG: type IX secretion system membrane protein PorP/SprF [Flavobacteriaceae bacterium]